MAILSELNNIAKLNQILTSKANVFSRYMLKMQNFNVFNPSTASNISSSQVGRG